MAGQSAKAAIRAQAPELPVVATTVIHVQRTERLAHAASVGWVARQDGPGRMNRFDSPPTNFGATHLVGPKEK